MKVQCFAVLVFVLLSCTPSGWSARILGFFPTMCRSHLIVDMSVVQGLVDRGHDLTVVTNIPLNEPNPRFKYIELKASEVIEAATNYFATSSSRSTSISEIFSFVPAIFHLYDEALKDPEIQILKEEGSFDLIIFDSIFFNDFQLGLAAHFNCPIVLIWAEKPLSILETMIGNPLESSYVPSYYLKEKQPLSFSGRLANFFIITSALLMQHIFAHIRNSYYESHFPPDKYPPLDTVTRNISLVMINHHFSQGHIRPNVPARIEIGGIQIKEKPNPLPLEIGTFLDDAGTDGAIYFSFGTLVKSNKLNRDIMKVIFMVLSGLKQRVLWKWENSDYPGNASNILYKNWFPQDDVLTHEHVKLFITHGGMGGIAESQYHGVPMVGMPFFADQMSNVQKMEASGFGLALDFYNITEESLRSALLEVLENPKYKRNIKKFSELYRDRPQTAKETALFWLEYVIRHKGALHMQSPRVHMSWWQILNLDVFALLLVVTLGVLTVCVLAVKFLRRCSLGFNALKNKPKDIKKE